MHEADVEAGGDLTHFVAAVSPNQGTCPRVVEDQRWLPIKPTFAKIGATANGASDGPLIDERSIHRIKAFSLPHGVRHSRTPAFERLFGKDDAAPLDRTRRQISGLSVPVDRFQFASRHARQRLKRQCGRFVRASKRWKQARQCGDGQTRQKTIRSHGRSSKSNRLSPRIEAKDNDSLLSSAQDRFRLASGSCDSRLSYRLRTENAVRDHRAGNAFDNYAMLKSSGLLHPLSVPSALIARIHHR